MSYYPGPADSLCERKIARFVGDLYSHVCVPNHWVEWNSNLVISSQNCAMCIKYYCINVVQGSVIDKVDILSLTKYYCILHIGILFPILWFMSKKFWVMTIKVTSFYCNFTAYIITSSNNVCIMTIFWKYLVPWSYVCMMFLQNHRCGSHDHSLYALDYRHHCCVYTISCGGSIYGSPSIDLVCM